MKMFIDYSGAMVPKASLAGLRVYLGEGAALPAEVLPPPSPRKYWTRRGIAEWLVERLAEEAATLAGIDHGFSFPLRYFETSRKGNTRWRRLIERQVGAKSLFCFSAPRSVAKSTHAGLPWLRFIRERQGSRVHL